MENKILLYIITGVSGSGKTTALKALEDMGFYCVDNLPTVLIPDFIEIIREYFEVYKDVAIGVDIREEAFLTKFNEIYKKLLKEYNFLSIKIVYLDAENSVLIKRFKETRREHPLKKSSFEESISYERKLLSFIKANSDIFVDTSKFNVHTLKKFIYNNFSRETFDFFQVNIVSFGFKNGILTEADLIFDVRFLNNPYFIDSLKNKTGNDKEVVEYIFTDNRTREFINRTLNLLEFLFPEYHKEGKNFIVIGIGCTGGRHRSVAIVNYLAKIISKKYKVIIRHRDLNLSEEEA